MNVVDSSGWVEYLSGGPNAVFFSESIEDVESLLVATLSLFEVYRHLLRHGGKAHALTIFATRLALADSMLLATAKAHGAMFWTQDAGRRLRGDRGRAAEAEAVIVPGRRAIGR